MSTSTAPIDNTFGALFIGTLIAMGLWGAASVQMYYYYNSFPKDNWRLKTLVAAVWALDTAHQGVTTHSTYSYLVTNYANPSFLSVLVPTLPIMVQISAFNCLLVQIFLIYRVWMMSARNLLLVVGISCLVIAQFTTTTLYFSKAIRMTSFAELPTIAWTSKLCNGLATSADISIALMLTGLLHRARTGFKRSESMINRLIIFTINTGVLTSIFAIFTIIFISLYPDEFIYIGLYVCISKMYTNTLFATLNARKATRDSFAASFNEGISITMTRGRTEAQQQARSTTRAQRGALAIHVDTETMQHADNIVLDDLESNRGEPECDDNKPDDSKPDAHL